MASRGLSRRQVLAGGLAAGALAGCRDPAPAPLSGALTGMELAERGHRVWARPTATPVSGGERADVVIVGAGVAGLGAAWRLKRAGFSGEVALLELGDVPGGTSAGGRGPSGSYPLGAHYITLPGRANRPVRALLEELGVITGYDGQGRPRYDDLALCAAPQERLFHLGSWSEGLWPEAAGDEAAAQLRDFQAAAASWSRREGRDGRPAFSIPAALASRDPEIRALAGVSFADWADQRGYTDPAMRWWLEYSTLDDYGCRLDEVSAWAGLHYHCARRPDPAIADLETHVLTWPGGNSFLVEAMAAGLPWPVQTGAVVRRVEAVGEGREVWYEREGSLRAIRARHVILAVPSGVADRLVDRPARALIPDAAPWRVAVLHCDRMPAARGLATAWDSVVYGAEDLGYVSNAHQRASAPGPVALTWYQPLAGDPRQTRRALAEASWEDGAAAVMGSLSRAHADLRERVQRLDVHHWGHGTVRPVVGLHSGEALAQAAAPLPGVSFAHTDLSGLSLFEEALWHGVRAAEDALAALGQPPEQSLLEEA